MFIHVYIYPYTDVYIDFKSAHRYIYIYTYEYIYIYEEILMYKGMNKYDCMCVYILFFSIITNIFAGPSAKDVLDPQLSAFVCSLSSLLASAKSLGGARPPRVITQELVWRRPPAYL